MSMVKDLKLVKIEGLAVDHLNWIRGLAAVVVLVQHTRQHLFVNYEEVAHPNPLLSGFYLVSGFGNEAVRVFFVLSGLFIGLSVLKAMKSGRWTWRAYLIARLTRLWLVLIPAILLCIFWDTLGMSLWGTGNYSVVEASGTSALQRFNLEHAAGNIFFLQRITGVFGPIVGPFGSDDPLWSLSYEFWYYMLFPLGLIALLSGSTYVKRVGAAALFIGIMLLVGSETSLFFLMWLTGAAVVVLPVPAFLKEGGLKVKLALAASLIFLLATLLFSRLAKDWYPWPGFLVALAMGLFVYLLLHTAKSTSPLNVENGQPDLYARGGKWLSGFSYTLYLVHTPVLFFFSAAYRNFSGGRLLEPTLLNISLAFGLMLLILAYAYFISRLTEAHTEETRQLVTAKLAIFWQAPVKQPTGK
ncbi:MAG TPA: acyltransferase [Chloroflexia bacterium]|nr:acyltransferase [Chloroflexia bacterium]